MVNIKMTISVLLLTSISVFAGTKQATYEVPTSQPDLKNSTLFTLSKVSVSRNIDNVTTLKYVVPEELTGEKNEIEFSGVLNESEGNLSSEYGVLNCLTNKNQMMCTASYMKLKFDSEKAKDLMAQKFQGQELENRLRLQEKFSTDPIGVIRIYFKNRSGLKKVSN